MYQNYPYYNDTMYQNFQQNSNLYKQQGLKGRPVTSYDEAKAAAIDFDGSLFIFPDLSNNKIYTKQLSTDGTAPLKVYELVEYSEPVPKEYVTKEELNDAINKLTQKIAEATPQSCDTKMKVNF